MSQPSIRPQVHEGFYVHSYFPSQLSLNFMVAIDALPYLYHFRLSQFSSPFVPVDTSFAQELLGSGTADAIDIGKSDLHSLVFR